MGRKGVSAEEKKTRTLDFFHETKTFFQLKEVEKRVSKEKGITSMAIKDVVDELISDGLVHVEKIGTSNYYWSYPSEAVHNLKRKLQQAEESVEQEKAKRKKVDDELVKAKVGRDDTEERSTALTELATEKQREADLGQELTKLADCDPEVLQAKVAKAVQAKDAANRWTDNVFCAKSWCEKKLGGGYNEKQFTQHMGIPAEFDYLD